MVIMWAHEARYPEAHAHGRGKAGRQDRRIALHASRTGTPPELEGPPSEAETARCNRGSPLRGFFFGDFFLFLLRTN